MAAAMEASRLALESQASMSRAVGLPAWEAASAALGASQ